MELFGSRFLAGGDSRFGEPPFASVRHISIGDIRDWIGPILAKSPLELSVVGDFDADAVKQWAGRYLGSLPERRRQERVDFRTPVFPDGQRLDIGVVTGIDKAMVVVAFATDDQWDIGRTRRLNVLSDVFAERIRQRVREELGAAYSPYAYHLPSRAYSGYGRLMAVAQVEPAQVDAVRQALIGIAADLAANGVEADELRRAVEPTLTGVKEMLRQNGYWLNTVLRGASRHPEQLDWSRTVLADYANIGADEVADLARIYLAGARPAVVTVRPDRP